MRSFLLSNALYWIEQFHIDGLRVDAVASMLYLDYSRQAGQWVPNQYGGRENLEAIEFLKQLNVLLGAECPGVAVFAEESTSWPGVTRPVHLGGLGFTYKWNMGWMHDMLDYTSEDPIHRKWHHNKITFSLMYAYSEQFVLPFSHDEVVHGKRSMIGKMPGDIWQRHATLRALYGYMAVHPGKKLLFMGGEIGQWREWNHDGELDWFVLGDSAHAGLQRWVRDLNRCYAAEPALWQDDHDPRGFQWVDCTDVEQSVVSLLRRGDDSDDTVVAVVSFTPVPRSGYRIGVPRGRHLSRTAQQRRRGVWRQQRRQPGARAHRAGSRAWLRAVAQPDGAAARVPPPQAGRAAGRRAPPRATDRARARSEADGCRPEAPSLEPRTCSPIRHASCSVRLQHALSTRIRSGSGQRCSAAATAWDERWDE